MAISKSIREALDALNDAELELELFVEAFSDLSFTENNPKPPAWVFPVQRQVERLRAASEVLEVLLRQKALPRLEDLEAIHRH